MNQQDELGSRISKLLDEGAERLTPDTRERLAAARRAALARQQRVAVRERALAWAGPFSEWTEKSLFGVRYVIPFVALLLGLTGVVYMHAGTVPTDIADIDAALLTDELPIDAYLDQGFDSWLKRSLR